jgi:flagellar biogenesis protein FliO
MRKYALRLAIGAALACLWPLATFATESASGQSSPVLSTPTPLPKQPSGTQDFGRVLGYLLLLTVLAGSGYYLFKNGFIFQKNAAGALKKLQVLEMRSLGNRQFLVVVGYEEQRMLLGVTPGKIDYLCPLDSVAAVTKDFSSMLAASESQNTKA